MSEIETTISEVLTGAPPPTVTPDASAADAARLMQDHHLSCVLVCEEDALVGIFTERDYLNLVAAERQDPERARIGDIMTANPETLQPLDSIAHGIHLMAVHGFRNVPILNRQGDPVGVLTVRDVVAQLGEIFAASADESADGTFDDWIDIGGG